MSTPDSINTSEICPVESSEAWTHSEIAAIREASRARLVGFIARAIAADIVEEEKRKDSSQDHGKE